MVGVERRLTVPEGCASLASSSTLHSTPLFIFPEVWMRISSDSSSGGALRRVCISPLLCSAVSRAVYFMVTSIPQTVLPGAATGDSTLFQNGRYRPMSVSSRAAPRWGRATW